MFRRGYLYLIIPTNDIVQEFQPSEGLLALINTTTKEVLQMFLAGWGEQRSRGFLGGFTDDTFSSYSAARSVHVHFLVADILFDSLERKMEESGAEHSSGLSEKDRKDLEYILLSLWSHFSSELFSQLENLKVSPEQLDRLSFVQWTGNDLIISIPTSGSVHKPKE